ncbi:MAG TPA: GNAT family N-acetyltransferase [Ktedonobacterales bacterium]|nr:GNAT family N-acetyltransferase [Ktedonobacterales bacterium]
MDIRPYQPTDQEQAEQCIIELQDYERALEPDRVDGNAIAQRYLHYLLATCQSKTGRLFVAEVDGQVVGLVCLWLEREPESFLTTLADYAYISDLVVLSAYRRQGIGSALLQQAEVFALEQGATALRIGVLAQNHAAHAAYRKAGFREYEISLLKPLKPPHPAGG